MSEGGQCVEFERFFDSYEHSVALAAQSVAKDFEQLFEDFGREYLLARKLRVNATPNLNVLKVFGLTNRELRHSDALAWFLREDAEHEQGDLFLRAFFEYLKISVPQQIGYIVERERYGNIDISAHAAGVFAIFIENKIRDREEEDRQFERLVESLIKFSTINRIPEDARVAVFLTDDGRPPVTGSKSPKITPRNVRRVDLFDFFAEALKNAPAKSPLLNQLLDNYIREIKLLL